MRRVCSDARHRASATLTPGIGEDERGDAVVVHARLEHRHSLDREVVLAHLEGVHPHERDA